jgi:predicted Rossmann-fold nucleotide-binding protein
MRCKNMASCCQKVRATPRLSLTGTLDELFEVWTWAQLGHHSKAGGIMNVVNRPGFSDSLIPFLDRLVTPIFVRY